MKRIWFLGIMMMAAACAIAGGLHIKNLQVGDLLFEEHPGNSGLTDAIVAATRSIDQYQFSHVAVVTEVGDSGIVVTEAVSRGVVETPLDSFLLTARHINEQPIVVVGRLKKTYRKAIAPALPRLKSLLGRPYDRAYLPGNADYYCSELIYETFLIDGAPIFEARPMTFKDKATGLTAPLWVEHFKRLRQPIPEGTLGTNPGDMSRSSIIDILGLIILD